MPIAPTSPVELLELVYKSGIASPERLKAAMPDAASLPPDPRKAAGMLIHKGLLTRFQATQLLQGRHKGFILGQHVVLDLLGRGGMGAVYLAQHQELHRKVAIKLLVPVRDADQNLALERFRREARAAAALDHPNIVRIFDVCKYGDVPYLVMEYVDGETLQEVLDRDGCLPPTTAADAIGQAAAGLQHAHERGFVHRDIKPGNLIRDRQGVVKILDMGLARSFDDPQQKLTENLDSGAVVGTADFISPEQALNTPNVDIRADIYSLGASFYTLMAGKPPFEGNTTQKLLNHQMKTAPRLSEFDPTVPEKLSKIVAKMMAKKPSDRYQTPGELIAALAPWLGNSARVVAGLSRTNLAIGSSKHMNLEQLANGSSSRHPSLAVLDLDAGPDSDDVAPSVDLHDTVVEAAARTDRAPRAPSREQLGMAKKKKKKRSLVFIGVGVMVLTAFGVVGALATGRGQAPKPQPESNPPLNNPEPNGLAATPTTTPAPVPPPKNDAPPLPTEKVIAKFELTATKPFTIRSGLEQKDTQRISKQLSKTGAEPPAGWNARCWNVDTQMEFFADAAGDGLAIRNVRGQGSAMLFMPKFECSTGVCRLKIEYAAPVKEKLFTIRFKAADNRQAWDVVRPPVTRAGVWRYDEFVADMKGATGGFFEFHNTDPSPDAAIRFRAVTVTEAPAGTPPTVLANIGAAPQEPDYANWKEGAVAYRLELAAIPAFRQTKEAGMLLTGEPVKLPAGVSARCWKPSATGEFRCEMIEGSPVLGLTNLSDEKSAQFAFELERDMNLTLKAETVYRVTVSYLTRNEATGSVVVQSQEYKHVASVKLPTTDGQWKAAVIAFERKDGVPVRVTLDNTAVGEGNTLFFRSLEIVELESPIKK